VAVGEKQKRLETRKNQRRNKCYSIEINKIFKLDMEREQEKKYLDCQEAAWKMCHEK
jgi:hypothetical protein